MPTSTQRESGDGATAIVEIVSIDRLTFTVRLRGEKVSLTPLEYGLLLFLAQNRHRVVGHAELAEQVLQARHGDAILALRVHICHLRRAIADPRHEIVTVRGRGYQYLSELPVLMIS